jgi:D-glycero-alpha-D-manno-heptose-7-phosphate kinase
MLANRSAKRGDPLKVSLDRPASDRHVIPEETQGRGFTAARGSVNVRAKAPLRLSFAGGGTDVSPFPETEGGVVLSATIDRFAYGSLSPRPDNQVSIESVDFGLSLDFPVTEDPVLDGKLDLVKAAIRRLRREDLGGYSLVLRSNSPPGSGLGSSSTMMVALVGMLHEFYRLPLDQYEIADLAHAIEREDLSIRGGLQDHYAAAFGGFNFIEFGERVIVNPLRVRDSTINELEFSLLLCFTGITRQSAHIISDQTDRVKAAESDTLAGLRAQKRLAVEMKSALLRGKLGDFGELLGEAWREKQRLSPMIATPRIQEAFEIALSNGAISGKVTGAGGGGYILFFCDFNKKHRVADALEQFGATPTEFSFEPRGLTTWRA